jgi:hypothetical protein
MDTVLAAAAASDDVLVVRLGPGHHLGAACRSGWGGPGCDDRHGARTRNALLRSLRCLGERGFALLTGRWRALQHITLSPSKIGDIARAALVLTHFEHGHIT